MDEKKIRQRVKDYYWQHDLNCATVTMKILAEQYSIELSNQVLDSTVGLHGAGNYGAQCGLVEGTLLFLGILGRVNQLPDDEISDLCCRYAGRFEEHFASLQCCELRPEGFSSELPPHLCEELSSRAITLSSAFLEEMLARHR
ncbi:MAG: C-GCAxxG-C-C family protein [Proteobacteria bacterium]|nr:C-GCAxxG-C-C family protein [Pseudomonadota bacterium]